MTGRILKDFEAYFGDKMFVDVWLKVDTKKFAKITDADLGYIADIIDGEGHFKITKSKAYEPILTITNTSLELFRWFKKKGADPRPHLQKYHLRKFPHHKPKYRAYFYPNDLRIMIPKVIDKLVIKRRHAEIIVRCLELKGRKRTHGDKGRWKKRDSEVTVKLNILRAELSKLNKRGR